ncbi:MAG TPA: UTP--glucose-1-phosphate uridylyltransferase [Chthoniobacterales bacterium]
MSDAETQIREKMLAAGMDETAIRAFLFQYNKLTQADAGLIPEASLEAVADLPSLENRQVAAAVETYVSQTAVMKLNGGLGTGMGLEKAKSLLRVRGELTFLDIIVRQFLRLRSELSPQLGLFVMNSFSTSEDTLAALGRYPELGDPRHLELLQNRVPKIGVPSLLPVQWPQNPQLEWCPPGHGDLYTAMAGHGLLKALRERGTQFLFVSNSDNLGATLDLRLLSYFAESGLPFLMEVTRRTAVDRKGGHLARRKTDGQLVLRESAQCPEEDMEAFQDTDRHRFFNTNNLWVRLDVLDRVLAEGDGILPLPLIRNEKTVDPRDKETPKAYQLETAMGAAIGCFEAAGAIEVPRSRFAPVKTTSDLLAVRSDAYRLNDASSLELIPERAGKPPVIKLSDGYKLVDAFETLVAEGVPSVAECEELIVEGPVRFAAGVKFHGKVAVRNGSKGTQVVGPGTYTNQELVW